jgi:hypothetical protein
MHADTLGGLIIGIPALLIAYLALWRRQRAVFFFAVALILVGVGYLVATGAAADIAHLVTG